MPRRRPSQKAKGLKKPRPVDRRDGKIRRWNKPADIELDEEDQFHASRDKILLDEGRGGDEEDGDEEEVFALRGVSSDSDASSDEHASDGGHSNAMQVDADAAPPSKSKPKAKSATKNPPPSDSDEEETWGRSKSAYYASNAAQLDSDDDEANELEEQEALRLQAKSREGLCDDDFGLRDTLDDDDEPPEAADHAPSTTPKVPRDKYAILRALEKEHPETLALARDWDDTVHHLMEAKARVEALDESDALEAGLQHMYYQALLTYTTTLAFYLALRATDKYSTRPDLLRRHPILARLLTLKQGIHTLENLGVGQDASANASGEDEDEEEDEDEDVSFSAASEDEADDLWSLIQKQGLESGELAGLLEDATAASSTTVPHPHQPARAPPPVTLSLPRRSSAARPPEPPQSERPKRPRKPAAHTFDLVEPGYPRASTSRPTPATTASKQRRPMPDSSADAFGEASVLDPADRADKHARKKSLRFHVSRIESASARRTQARAATGGDDDIPYRERTKAREARLDKERARRQAQGLLGAGGDDLDDADPERVSAGGGSARKRKRGDGERYYDLVQQASAAKKARKQAAYDAATARPTLSETTSGPRSVTRAILKNKGLTPRRSKTVRNPRVKKRQKYDQAKKRVASQKAVYKGGIGDVSKYSGEQSGISKVVKSVRL